MKRYHHKVEPSRYLLRTDRGMAPNVIKLAGIIMLPFAGSYKIYVSFSASLEEISSIF